jgi:hypothetical protein
MDWLNQKIKETEKWLSQNQRQASLPTMEIEDALHKQEVSHKREILSLLHQFRHHPLSNPQQKENIEQKHF